MFMKKRNFLSLMLIIFPYTLYAWGDGDKLNDGSCKFDLETGYIDSSLYIKENESFLIVNGGDSRYGTISTIYNALTCEKVTSGDSDKSDFSGLMERKGFIETDLNSNKVVDKSFQNKITFLKNEDELIIHIEPIENSVTEELNTLLASLSDKSLSSQINISDSAKEFLGYREFYAQFLDKLNSLSATDINFDYTLSLNSKLKSIEETKGIILAKQEETKGIILAKQEEVKKRLAKLEKERENKANVYHKEMVKKNLQAFIKNYGISGYIYKNRISWKPDNEWDYHSGDHSITGRGRIWFEPYGDSLNNGYIEGEFNNGKLVSSASLEIDGSKCTQRAVFLCKESANGSYSKTVTSKTLASAILSGISKVEDQIYQNAYGGYNEKKRVGQKVCMHVRTAFGILPADISAYVEGVSGDRIQLRISDTGGSGLNYNGTTLRQGTIIWDDYNRWEPCS